MSDIKSAVKHVVPTLDESFPACRGIYIGTGGDVSVTVGGTTEVYKNVPDAGYLALEATMITSDSTADDFLVHY